MRQNNSISLPSPSRWGIDANIAGRPIVRGIMNINSLSGNTISGTVSFRNMNLPIAGIWDESTSQIYFESPYASFIGKLTIYDDAAIGIRHHVFTGRVTMKETSEMAGESGNWIAATDTKLQGPAVFTGATPPVGVYLLSDLLYRVY